MIGATADDARDIMIEGESGILAICPEGERPQYNPSKRRLEWPNGARSLIFTADEPERLRGKQHQRLWGDEVAAWRYPEAIDQALLGLRLPGQSVRAVWTTTPKPTRAMRELQAQEGVVITRGTSYDNRANLDPAWFAQILRKYEGTRLGRQELLAEDLDDVPGALWTRAVIDALRVKDVPDLYRIVVAIDPAMTSGDDADETGIVVAGKGECRCKGEREDHAFVLADVSGHYTPDGWAKRAIAAFIEWKADRVVAEVNNGGEMVEHTLRTADSTIPYRALHASRGKRVRAEPIAALYEQGKVHHVGSFSAMEDQMANYTPDGYDGSPDRLDAMVWALTELDLHQSWVVA
jgi:phage terminase large subunit-like protein